MQSAYCNTRMDKRDGCRQWGHLQRRVVRLKRLCQSWLVRGTERLHLCLESQSSVVGAWLSDIKLKYLFYPTSHNWLSFPPCSGPRSSLQTQSGSLPWLIHYHWVGISSIHLRPQRCLLQKPSASSQGNFPSQSPPDVLQLPPYGLWGAGRAGAVVRAAPSRKLEVPVEKPPLRLPLLSTQPGLSQLPLHLLLSWTFSWPPSQKPLP